MYFDGRSYVVLLGDILQGCASYQGRPSCQGALDSGPSPLSCVCLHPLKFQGFSRDQSYQAIIRQAQGGVQELKNLIYVFC